MREGTTELRLLKLLREASNYVISVVQKGIGMILFYGFDPPSELLDCCLQKVSLPDKHVFWQSFSTVQNALLKKSSARLKEDE
jgi:hypothetical protein